MHDPFFAGDLMFQIGPIFIAIIFIIVISLFVFTISKGISQWHKNEKSPRLIVPAILTSKRTDVRRSSNLHNDHHHSSTHTHYYVTFEFESGDRSEFHVSGKEFGLLTEGDTGRLTFQGTRYVGFERKPNS
ncbi:DUF2500 domain-containing protein [Bacillus sp. PS06]|uniref:DUF2500 domain-containing protein n=1 Tax=Bacillus sp. PS06 TaxID=2764176 RepID=UPI001783037D|nr:DUF2500 domain-containing protein [Bacillus sp. PS06]MBD8067398.1 DUF2500 domain-containing protein [Bacillus sp. PS06]